MRIKKSSQQSWPGSCSRSRPPEKSPMHSFVQELHPAAPSLLVEMKLRLLMQIAD